MSWPGVTNLYHKENAHKWSTKDIQEAREHGHKPQLMVLADFKIQK